MFQAAHLLKLLVSSLIRFLMSILRNGSLSALHICGVSGNRGFFIFLLVNSYIGKDKSEEKKVIVNSE